MNIRKNNRKGTSKNLLNADFRLLRIKLAQARGSLHSNMLTRSWRQPVTVLRGAPLLLWLKRSLLLAAVAALAGCATPQYATQTSYTPPQTAKGLICVAQCQDSLKQCQNSCSAARQSCIAHIEPAARAAFDSALKTYEVQRRQYETDRQFYELNRSLRMGFSSPVFVPHYGWVMRPGYYNGYFDDYNDNAPTPPVAPSLAKERQRLIHERCDSAPCPCQQNFEQCYVGCGGGVKKSVVCIANCKDSDPKPEPQPPAGTQ